MCAISSTGQRCHLSAIALVLLTAGVQTIKLRDTTFQFLPLFFPPLSYFNLLLENCSFELLTLKQRGKIKHIVASIKHFVVLWPMAQLLEQNKTKQKNFHTLFPKLNLQQKANLSLQSSTDFESQQARGSAAESENAKDPAQ